MREHRGKILEEAIRRRGYSLSSVAEQMKISRRTLYNYFEDAQLDLVKLENFNIVLHLDLETKFTKLRKYPAVSNDQSSAQDDVNYWRNKYFEVLEKYSRLLEQQ